MTIPSFRSLRRRATASRGPRARAAAQACRNHDARRTRSLRTALTAAALPLLLLPATISAQTPELVFLSGITATSRGGDPLTTVEEQTAAALDALGEQLEARGLGYGTSSR